MTRANVRFVHRPCKNSNIKFAETIEEIRA